MAVAQVVTAILSIAAPQLTAVLRFQVKVIATESMFSAIDAHSLDAVSQVVDVEVLGHAVRNPMAVKRVEETALSVSYVSLLLCW